MVLYHRSSTACPSSRPRARRGPSLATAAGSSPARQRADDRGAYAGARMIVLDEAARIDDDLIAALRPMMATVDGSLIALVDSGRQARVVLRSLDRRRELASRVVYRRPVPTSQQRVLSRGAARIGPVSLLAKSTAWRFVTNPTKPCFRQQLIDARLH